MIIFLEGLMYILEFVLLAMLYLLIPVAIAFLFGFVRGSDYESNQKCELCEAARDYRKAQSDLDKAYADYGRAVWSAVQKRDGQQIPECYGKPNTPNGRAEYGCDDCPAKGERMAHENV